MKRLKRTFVAINLVVIVFGLNASAITFTFEEFLGNDGAQLSAYYSSYGISFEAASTGQDWVACDTTTARYNASSWPSGAIMGGSGQYWIYNNVSAWTGIVGDDGIIRFSNNVTFVEMGYSAGATLYLEAYNSADNLLDQDSGPANLRFANGNETGPGTLRVDAPPGEFISYVTIHDTGNLWTIDNLTTDATVTEPWSFVQISDTHIGYTEWECTLIGGFPYCWQVDATRTRLVAVLNKVLREERPLFIVNTGDIADIGCDWLGFCGTDNAYYRSYSEAMRLVTDSNIRVYNIPGNHDQRTGILYLQTLTKQGPSFRAQPRNLFK